MSVIPPSSSLFYIIFALISFVTITVLLVLPNETFPEVKIVDIDKVVHIIVFGGMTFNFYMWKPNYKIHILIGGIVYGIAMEFVQEYWCVNRSFAISDMIADAIGCLVGLGVAALCLRAEKK